MIPGNMGLSDQAMALRWVRENIHNFQGEPDKITLVGHEAGAACVGIHLISPITSKSSNNKYGTIQRSKSFVQM